METAVYILTTMVVLETAQHVLNIGQGIAEIDMSALTLHQIKNTVKRIEGKVDRILQEPLNTAKRFFDNAIIEITNKSYNDAYQTLDRVIENAMKGLDYACDSVESFEECAKATKLIVFSTILRHSYDEGRRCFKPIFMLSEEKQKLIGDKLESIVEELSKRKDKVKTTGIFGIKAKKSRVQNMFDSVLKIVYPYVSQARKWTDMKRKVEKKVKLPLMPKYLPDGKEDSAEMIVGVRDGSSVVRVNVWREKDIVYCKYGAKTFRKTIKHKPELLMLELDPCPGPITLSFTGDAAEKWAAYQGEYHLTDQEHNGAPVYRNSHDTYLYTFEDGTWRAGYVIGGYGIIQSVETGAACPAAVTQWQWLCNGVWHSGDIAATCTDHI